MSEVVNRSAAVSVASVVDPVCRMSVRGDGSLRAEYVGRTYVFCSDSCLKSFQDDPSAFVANEPAPAGDSKSTSR